MSEEEIIMDREIANYLRANIDKLDEKIWAILLYLVAHQCNDIPATAIIVKNHERMLFKQEKERYKSLIAVLEENSIPKKQIQDKIDELKEELEYPTIANEARIQIRLLEELLKGE